MIVDYYRSDGFSQDLREWVEAPIKSSQLRRHIVTQMNTNRLALGRSLTGDLETVQGRFIAGEMSYDELVGFIEEYVGTIRVTAR